MEEKHTHRPLIIAGPSGAGKSTLVKLLQQDFPNMFGYSISHTTRSPRPGEVNGVNYWFTDRESFLKEKSENKFIETAEYAANLYGTSIKAVADVQHTGKICLLDIDLQGVISFKSLSNQTIKPYYAFIVPPSIEELRRRLDNRKDTSNEAIDLRLKTAERELQHKDTPGFWDFVLVNDNLDVSHKQFKEWILEHYPELKEKK